MLENPKTPPLRILAGSGRSGTTWLLDVLCEANALHPIFEPLHPEGWGAVHKLSRRYASADEAIQHHLDFRPPELENLWGSLREGNYPSTWIDHRIRPDKLRPRMSDFTSVAGMKRLILIWDKFRRHRSLYRRPTQADFLIKVIRANLLLPLLANRPDVEWVLVMRHPAAVVESQLRIGGDDWNAKIIAAYYFGDKALEARLGCDWGHWVNKMRSDAELLTLVWCLENTLPLEDIDQAENRLVFYEKLASHDAMEWEKLLGCLALKHLPEGAALRRPSQQSSEAMRKDVGSRKKSALDRLKPADRDGIQRVLDLVGVKFYHTDSLMPEPDNIMANRPWFSCQGPTPGEGD